MARINPNELSKFGGLTLVDRTIVEGFLAGIHRSPFKGFSVEFTEHRAYTPGDEIRRIDWRAYGKTDKFFVKEYEDETNLTAYLVVDSSASMAYRGKQELSKFEYAQRVAASLSYLLLAQQDAVGLIIHDAKVRHQIPPKANSKQLISILQALEQTQPTGQTAIADIWHSLAGHYLKRRGLVILISDVFDQTGKVRKAISHLRHFGHDVLLLNIVATEEAEFPFTKPTRFRDLENPDNMKEIIVSKSEYTQLFVTWDNELQKTFSDLNADRVLLKTNDPFDRALGAYLAKRNKK